MLVTVITPAYNAEKYILDAIVSVAEQNIDHLEMIIIDDNSLDNTLDILKEAILNYPFLTVIHNNKNMGPAFCRNIAIRKAKGKYLAFLDADDLWVANKLALQLEFMREEKLNFSYTSYYLMNEAGESLDVVLTGKKNINYQQLLYNCPIGCLTVIYEKKQFKTTYMPNVPRGQDYGFWLKLFKQDIRAGYMEQPLAKYRKISGSISSAKQKKIVNMYQLFSHHLGLHPLSSFLYVISHIYHSYMKSRGFLHTKTKGF